MKGKSGVVSFVILLFQVASGAQNAPPLPTFERLSVRGSCTALAGGLYSFEYLVTNPAENTVGLWTVELSSGVEEWEISNHFGPPGWSKRTWGRQFTPNPLIAPQTPSIEWNISNSQVGRHPGDPIPPMGFTATAPPSIREIWISPWLDPWFDEYFEATGEEEFEGSVALERSYIRKIPTLAPLPVPPGTFEHWDVFLSDVSKAGELGWISDAALLSGIRENLSAARQAALQGDLHAVNGKLDLVIAAVEGANERQMRREAKDLIVLNARYLKANLPWPCEPKLTLEPEAAAHPLGETAIVTARLVNTATGLPIAQNGLTIEVTEGPHAGTKREGATDAEGKLMLSYVGTRLGEDKIVAHTPFGTIAAGAEKGVSKATASRPKAGTAEDCTAWDLEGGPVRVKWDGGPDLIVPLFVPPVLMSGPGQAFYVTEKTKNQGNLPSGPSVTRYYLSATKPVDPATAVVVGQRSVPALAPGEESQVFEAPFTVPQDLPPGTYYLDACADADGAVVETKEDNNCASLSKFRY